MIGEAISFILGLNHLSIYVQYDWKIGKDCFKLEALHMCMCMCISSSLTWQYGGHSGDNEGHNDPRTGHLLGNQPWDHIHPCPDAAAHTQWHKVHCGQHPGQSGPMWAGARNGRVQHGLHRLGPQDTGRKRVPCRAPLYPARVQLPCQTTHAEGVRSNSQEQFQVRGSLMFCSSVTVLFSEQLSWTLDKKSFLIHVIEVDLF